MYNLVSVAGIFILMAFAWAISANRKVINRRVVIWGVGLQLLIGVFIFCLHRHMSPTHSHACRPLFC